MSKQKVYLDRRATTNGKKSHIHLDNSMRLGLLPPGGNSGQVLTKLTDQDYDVYWEDINSLINSIINPIQIDNALFVMQNGNNATAQVGALHLPWADPIAAAFNQQPGQTIIIYPGIYNLTPTNVDRIMESNGNMLILPGAFINVSGTNSTINNFFNVSGRIYNQGIIQVIGQDAFPSRTTLNIGCSFQGGRALFNRCVLIPNPNADFEFERLELSSSQIRFTKALSTPATSWRKKFKFNKVRKFEPGSISNSNVYSNTAFLFEELNDDPTSLDARPQYLSIEIESLEYGVKDKFNGLFHFTECSDFTNINVDVYNLTNTELTNPLGSSYTSSIISLNNTYHNIDFKVHNSYTNHCWITRHATGITGMKGTISIKGILYNNEDGDGYPLYHGLIDMKALSDRIVYHVDVINYMVKWPILFNITGNDKSTLTGRVVDLANVEQGTGLAYPNGLVTFGLTTTITGSTSFASAVPVFMRDFQIITNLDQPCFEINSALAAGTPINCYNVISNNLVDITNTPAFPIQNILVNPAIV